MDTVINLIIDWQLFLNFLNSNIGCHNLLYVYYHLLITSHCPFLPLLGFPFSAKSPGNLAAVPGKLEALNYRFGLSWGAKPIARAE